MDQETYKIVFDLGIEDFANDISKLNDRLRKIEPLVQQTKSDFKNKAETASLLAAFASAMKIDKTKSKMAKIETKFLTKIIERERVIKDKSPVRIEDHLKLLKEVEVLSVKTEKMKPFAKLGQTKYPQVVKRLEVATQELIYANKALEMLSKEVKILTNRVYQKNVQIASLNTALDSVYAKVYYLSHGYMGDPGRLRPKRIRDIGMDLSEQVENVVKYRQRMG